MTRVLLVPDLPIERWPSMDRYASRLAAQLPRANPDLEFVLAGPVAPLTNEAPVHGSGTGRNIAPPRVGELRRYVSRYLVYPRRVRAQRGDVLHVLDHSYAHLVPHRGLRPAVLTVHDLIPLLTVRRRPTGLRDRIRNLVLEHVLRAMRRADRWIVSTHWLRDELAEWLGEDHRIDVIPHGVDDGYFSPPDRSRADLRVRLGVPTDRFVVLHVGSVVERKNVPGVLAAVDGLRARKVPVWLLQVGGRFTEGQRREIAARGLADVVTQLPETAEADLRAAYRAADVLLFPSHYEGFGLPVLEAMASELPIVTSAAPALAEVAADAAAVIDSRDPTLYVDALERIASDRAWADELRRRGRARARGFTWSETARRTGEVYHRLV